jgi:hypothetical protein
MLDIWQKEICNTIFQYIEKELSEQINDEIFRKTSFDDLGEWYYNQILSAVEGANTELLNLVIRGFNLSNLEHSDSTNYYTALCKILRIQKLPSEIIVDVQREYEKIFVHEYNNVLNKYHIEIEQINRKLNQVKEDSNIIKNTPSSYSFMRDISEDENKLYNLVSECNLLRTRKEMLEFALSYVNSKLSSFCDLYDTQSVENAKRRMTLKLAKNNDFDVEVFFLSYQHNIKLLEDDIDRPYGLFFKVKMFVINEMAEKTCQSLRYTKSQDEAIKAYQEYLSLVPSIDDLNLYRTTDPNTYNTVLEKLISDYNLLDRLINDLNSSVCLRNRKNILLKAVNLYKQGEFEIFNSMIPTQVEGMFEDYLKDTTTFLRFSKMDIYNNAVLKDKIRRLQDVNTDIYPDAVEYFMYYYNNMIRNKIAHGKYSGNLEEKIQDEIFAKELILDLLMLVYMLSRTSETEKMYRFIHGYHIDSNRYSTLGEKLCFGRLFNDMIGQKLILEYDSINQYKPIQVVYWLINPYYEKIYEQVADVNELLELRSKFLSKEFWEYVLNRLTDVINEEYDYLNINKEIISIVNGLFSCNVTSDVKKTLGQVHAALQKINSLKFDRFD